MENQLHIATDILLERICERVAEPKKRQSDEERLDALTEDLGLEPAR
jgi:hypothetical protein